MKIKNLIKLLLTMSLISGCATIFTGTTQNIHLQAVDAKNNQTLSDVSCSIMDGKGVSHIVPTNPGTSLISKGSGALIPTCIKVGYVQKNYGVGDSFSTVTLINILFWPGFIVDAVSGAMHKYPSHITVFMEPKIN